MSKTKGSMGSVRKHLLIKSREAMMAAVQIYNNPLISFKSESFIVLSNIAWTYLLHAYYKSIKLTIVITNSLVLEKDIIKLKMDKRNIGN